MTITATHCDGHTLYRADTPEDAAYVVAALGMIRLHGTRSTFATPDFRASLIALSTVGPVPTWNARLRNRSTV